MLINFARTRQVGLIRTIFIGISLLTSITMKYVILWVLIIDVGALTGVVLSLCQILICGKVINKVIETYKR